MYWFKVLILGFILLDLSSSEKIPVQSVSRDKRFYKGTRSFKNTTSVRKCCPFGEEIWDRKCSKRVKNRVNKLDAGSSIIPLRFEIGMQCSQTNSSRIMRELTKDRDFIDSDTGKLYLSSHGTPFSRNDYCVDYVQDIFRVVVCYEKLDEKIETYNIIGAYTPIVL
ncbi:hypothetical protein HHI36_020595 [Cryptolaemus montrouzieri]|uniref:Uncharacterized protein n=1 Tax=Cryptolaemus montrouzieri TaxID=559131 RepID=A0ABD2NBW6_9CUCU